ncbi:MAG: hypothetical protein GC205_00970 [Bacteroidetes bacterium]|nr:hypothetical protein [Bacteroidota bacterium]
MTDANHPPEHESAGTDANEPGKRKGIFSRLGKWTFTLLWRGAAFIVLSLIAIYVLFLFPEVQQWTAVRASAWASNQSGTEVRMEKIRLRFVRKFAFGEVYVADYNGDTLLYTRELVARVDGFDPFKRQLLVRHIRIRGAHFVMRREMGDSTFSFSEFTARLTGKDPNQPIVDNVAPKPESPSTKKKTKKTWQLGLGDLEMGDGRFQYRDHNSRTYMDIGIPHLVVLMRRTNPSAKILHASKVAFTDLDVRFFKPDSARGPLWGAPPDTPRLNTSGWVYTTDELLLENCRFRYNDARKLPKEGLDYAHLEVDDIFLRTGRTTFRTDTIQGMIRDIRARDKSGAELSKLTASLLLTPYDLQLEGLVLETPDSRITDTVRLQYGTFQNFESFEEDVRMDAWLRDSYVSARDLQLFAPDLTLLGGAIGIDGHIYGYVNALHGRDLGLTFGQDSRLLGRFDVTGLPDAEESFIEFKLTELVTRDAELRSLLPGLALPPILAQLGDLRAEGEFIGFPRDFVAFGEVNTGLGSVNSDLNLKIEPERDLVTYSGNLDLTSFDLGRWTGRPDWLGAVTVRSAVSGTGKSNGFGLGNLDANLEANVSSLVVKGYQYTNLIFDGQMQEGFFSGSLESADPNFDQTFQGTIDLREQLPVFDFQTEIRNVDFFALGLMPEPLSMQGQLVLNLVGDHIDSVLGQGGLYNLVLRDAFRTYALDSLTLLASEQEGLRSLELRADLFNALFQGDFALTRMPDAIKQLVNHYFPNAGIAYDASVSAQDLAFAVNIRDSKDFLKLLDPKLGRVRDASVSGNLSTGIAAFDLRARFPELEYGGMLAKSWVVDVQSTENSLKLFTRSESLVFGDSMRTPVTVLETDYQNDSLFFRLMLGRDQDPDRLNLAGAVTAEPRAFRISILPSEIYTRNERWDISPNNSLVYDYERLVAKDFTLTNGEQQIGLSSLNKEGFDSWLDLDFRSVKIGNLLTAFHLNPMNMQGTLHGRVSGSNVLSNLGFAANLRVEEFALDELPLGKVTLNASMQRPENQLNFLLAMTEGSDVRARGNFDLNAGGNIEADVRIDRLPVTPLGYYLQNLFDQLGGDLSGDIQLRGTLENPVFSGEASIDDAALRLMYTNSRYEIPTIALQLLPGRLTIAPAMLFDQAGNSGTVEGAVTYTRLDAWRFDNLQITTENMQFMNTDRVSNPEFFGTAFGSGRVSINGPMNDILISIFARSNRGTSLVVPITYGPSISSGSSFVRFRQPVTESGNAEEPKRNTGRVRFDFYVDVTEDAEVTMEILGDRLQASGTGNLHLEISTLGDFTMDGIYQVSQGSYAFSLQDLVSKDFRLAPGSSITWTGDPYLAMLNVDAVYTARASQWDLVSDFAASMTPQEVEQAQQLINFDVYLSLRGSLEAPDILFDIRMQSGQSGGTSIFERRLQEIKADQNELNKQVFGLLVVNRFIPQESGISPLLSGASSSVSEFVAKQLSVYVSDWVSDYLITDVDIDISYRNYQNVEEELTQQELQVQLSKRFFDNRIYVNIGGNFGLGANQDPTDLTGRNNNVAGDFEIEYALTADGRFRIKAFQRPDFDIVSGRNIAETGVGLFYSQEFNSLGELVADRRKRKAIKQGASGEPVETEQVD